MSQEGGGRVRISRILWLWLMLLHYEVALLNFFSEGGVALSEEKRLIKHLLDEYQRVGKLGRPVYNTSNTISVKYGLALIQILDLDEKNQVLTTNCWSRYVSNNDVSFSQKPILYAVSILIPDQSPLIQF